MAGLSVFGVELISAKACPAWILDAKCSGGVVDLI